VERYAHLMRSDLVPEVSRVWGARHPAIGALPQGYAANELAIDRSVAAMETDPACEFVKAFCSAVEVDLTNVVGFTTDAPHLLPLGAPIVIFGPGKPRMCHQVDEYLEINDLRAGVEFFNRVIGKFLT